MVRPSHFRVFFAVWSAGLLLGSLGRLHALQSLSPPDLAFFHQSCWSASQGLGFQQTGLEFDRGTLMESMHLSLVRILWLPLYWLLPRIELLLALQALSVAATGWAALRLATGKARERSAVLIGVIFLSPLFPVLATVDLRPLVFILPGSLWVMVALRERRVFLALVAALFTLSAREEAPYVLLAMIPWSLWENRNGGSRWVEGTLALVAMGGWICMDWWWSGADNIRTTMNLDGVVTAIGSGERPLFRWEQEWRFALVVLIASLPAFRCPLLLMPGLGAWLYLSVLSDFEPMAPGNGGLHYLAVIAPFVIGALALGVARLQASGWLRGPRAQLAWGLALLCATPQWIQTLQWGTELVHLSDTGPREMASELRSRSGGVLADPRVAPLLSGREVLRIQGHFQVTEERAALVAEEVEWALLPHGAPAGDAGALEWSLWQTALPQAGLKPLQQEEGWILWGRE